MKQNFFRVFWYIGGKPKQLGIKNSVDEDYKQKFFTWYCLYQLRDVLREVKMGEGGRNWDVNQQKYKNGVNIYHFYGPNVKEYRYSPKLYRGVQEGLRWTEKSE